MPDYDLTQYSVGNGQTKVVMSVRLPDERAKELSRLINDYVNSPAPTMADVVAKNTVRAIELSAGLGIV